MSTVTSIVAYTYMADTYCPACMVHQLTGEGRASVAAADMCVEDVLDQIAGAEGYDRSDEFTFDSWEFPKVVFRSHLNDCQHSDDCSGDGCDAWACGSCGGVIE